MENNQDQTKIKPRMIDTSVNKYKATLFTYINTIRRVLARSQLEIVEIRKGSYNLEYALF